MGIPCDELLDLWLRLDAHALIPLHDFGVWGFPTGERGEQWGAAARFSLSWVARQGYRLGHVNDRESAVAPTACPAVRRDADGIVRGGRRPGEGAGFFACRPGSDASAGDREGHDCCVPHA